MELKELKEKRSEDLAVRLGEIAEELFHLTCTSEPVTPQKGVERKALRKERARIMTLLRQRELDSEVSEKLKAIEEKLEAVGNASDRTSEERARAASLRRRRQHLSRVRHELDSAKS